MSASPAIYLDHNATTPPAPEVVEVMARASRDAWGNPSSDHAAGRAAREALERATAEVAALVGAEPDEIVFTSGGTESNDLAIRGVAAAAPSDRRRVVISAVEHPAIHAPCAALARDGWSVDVLPVDSDGRVGVPDRLGPDVALVSVMLANNETGAVMAEPLTRLADQARAIGARVHTDAAQAVGRIPVDVRALGVDLLTIVGHKLYGPKGIGALVVRRGTPIQPRLGGGGQQRGLRPGTEPVPTIAGLGEACAVAGRILAAESERQRRVCSVLVGILCERVPGLVVTAGSGPRLPNTAHVRFPRVLGRRVLAGAPEVAASTGSACHAGMDHPSPVLVAMGVGAADALGAVRLTVGRSTTESDAARAAHALARAWSEADGDR